MKTATLTREIRSVYTPWPAGTRVAIRGGGSVRVVIERLEHDGTQNNIMHGVPTDALQFDPVDDGGAKE